jgi:hypothetical protein
MARWISDLNPKIGQWIAHAGVDVAVLPIGLAQARVGWLEDAAG